MTIVPQDVHFRLYLENRLIISFRVNDAINASILPRFFGTASLSNPEDLLMLNFIKRSLSICINNE